MRVRRVPIVFAAVFSLMSGSVVVLPPLAAVAADPVPYQEKSVPVTPIGSKTLEVTSPPKSVVVAPVWPSGGSGTVTPGAGMLTASQSKAMVTAKTTVGGLPVAIGVPSATSVEDNEQRMLRGLAPNTATTSGVSSVEVSVWDQAAAKSVGVTGVALTVMPSAVSSFSAGSGLVEVTVDYSGFANAYGGGYGDRLRLVNLPGCAVSTPQLRECQAQTPVSGARNDKATASVSGLVDLGTTSSGSVMSAQSAGAGGATVLAVTAGVSSEQGNWSATSLGQALSWQAGASAGGFSYSVPVEVPAVPGGLVPQISFDYSSAGVDGMTKSTSSQSSWLGDGWNFEPGYIERSYRPCVHDGVPNNLGDLCFVGLSPMTMVLNGQSSRLLQHTDGSWWAEDDSAGWRVERLLGAQTGVDNGARDGETFKVSTRDGTQYFFGSRHPSAGGGVLNVEVYTHEPQEPCYSAVAFRYGHCQMPYRWNLDHVVDVKGNVIDYQWRQFRGAYAGNGGTDFFNYDISGSLTAIEYGMNVNAGTAGAHHGAKVVFNTFYRCFDTLAVCEDVNTNRYLWRDSPWDQFCYLDATSCSNYAPTFWQVYRLTDVTTYLWDPTLNSGAGGWPTVNNFVKWLGTTQSWASPGDLVPPAGEDSSPSLWMSNIWRTGHLTSLSFGGVGLKNRVDWGCCDSQGLQIPPMVHWRVNQINSGVGETVNVTYAGEDCQWNNLPASAIDNNRRCYPQNNDGVFSWWHKPVVTDVTVADTVGGSPTQWSHYTYSTAGSSVAALWKYDVNWIVPASQRTWSRWAGYATVTARHSNLDLSGPVQYSESLYYRGFKDDNTGAAYNRAATVSDGYETVTDWPTLAGKVRREWTFNGPPNAPTAGSNWIASTQHHYSVTNTGGIQYLAPNPTIYSQRVREHQSTTGSRSDAGVERWGDTVTTFDTLGLPVTTMANPDRTPTGDDHCTVYTYTPANTAKWLIGLPSQTITGVDCTPSTATEILTASRTTYDSLAWNAMPATGLVTKTETIKAATGTVTGTPILGADWFQTSAAAIPDAYGRFKETYDPLNRKTTTVYTPSLGGPVTSVKTTGPTGWDTTADLDPKYGLPTTVTDVNGMKTQAEYDGDGRLIKVWKNNRPKATSTPDVEYGYHLDGANWISTKTLGPDGQQILSYQIFDGLLRPRQTHVPSPTGTGRTITSTHYNGIGAVAKTTTYFNSSPPGSGLVNAVDEDITVQVHMSYDNPGRTILEEQKTGNGIAVTVVASTSYSYDNDRVTVTPPTGGTATTTISDAQGKTTELRQHQGGTPAGAFTTTLYAYDRLGQLKTVTDPLNNQWSYDYDLLGRKTKTVDPDAGTSYTSYHNDGQVQDTTDARGIKLVNIYDTLGRKTSLRETTAGGTERASWTYDGARLGDPLTGVLVKGQLSSTTRKDGGLDYISAVVSYDDAYRPTKTTETMPGFGASGGTLTYTVDSTYKANGALFTQKLPIVGGLPGETLTYGYHASTGLPNTLTTNHSQGTYIASTIYRYDGKVGTQDLGVTGKQVRQNNNYGAATRRLESSYLHVETATAGQFGTSKYGDVYTYDQAGNITAIAGTKDGAAEQQQCFTHDHLRRLTKAWTQTSGACTTPQRTGADPYWRKWPTTGGFDAIGNRLTQEDKEGAGTTWTNVIGGTDTCGGTAKAHQVRQITSTGLKAGAARNFCYDAAGNMTTRTTETGVVQDLTWDSEGHLATIKEGTTTVASYVYDPNGQRLIGTTIAGSTTTKTLYLPDGTELAKINTADPLGNRYYSGVAVRDTGGLKWTIGTQQGSGTFQIDALTKTVSAARRFMPYGEPRTTQPAGWIGTRGYVGGTTDTTGLTHLGAREYDPTIGRFTSVDPVMDLTDPQQWNAYTYSNSNPVTWSDPSGLTPECGNNPGECSSAPSPSYPDESTSARGGGSSNSIASWPPASVCAVTIECEPLPGFGIDPTGGGAGPWTPYVPYILEMAWKTGLDPALLLANFIIESYRCMAIGDTACGAMQALQKNTNSIWWVATGAWWVPVLGDLMGQGDHASIGYANFEKEIFDNTRANHPELAGRAWEELIDDPLLNIEAMAYHLQDLSNALPDQLGTGYSRHELIRFGFRTGVDNMHAVATGGSPMGPESIANNQMYLQQYARARTWIAKYMAGYCGGGVCQA